MDTEIFGVAAVPIILGLVQVAREAGLPSRFAPLLSLLLGAAGGVGAEAAARPFVWEQGLVLGVALGLSASGLYSGVAKFTQPQPPTPAA